MTKIKKTPQQRLDEFLSIYGSKVVNLIIERHLLSSEKRSWFTIRFSSEDPEEEKDCTEKMEELDEKIYKVDKELLDAYGIDSKYRVQILRDLKKVYPEDWIIGFKE